VFAPQMIVWNVLYGQPFTGPQGPSFLRWSEPHVIDVLFSDNHGLFTWTPIVLLSLIGVVRLARRVPGLALPVGVVVAGSWYVNAAVADWWGGEAFGARRFLSLFPLFTLGLAVWVQPLHSRVGRWPLRAAAAWTLVGANALLLFQYQLFMKGLGEIAPYPRGWVDMWLTRFVVPIRFLEWWWS
jgi:hypothetical protein